MSDYDNGSGSVVIRRALTVLGGLVAVAIVAAALLWFNCGLRGCPDVALLSGYTPDEASVVLDRDGEEVSKLFLVRRVVVSLDSLPDHVADAFVAIEDQRFWSHGGIDIPRILGAAWQNIRTLGVTEGGSTITMQLAGNVFVDRIDRRERTIWRKVGEARVARQIESRFTKREILGLYINQIFYGHGSWGIQAAAQEYFGKDAADLDLGEAALLAGLPKAPSRLNPRYDLEGAVERRALVLQRMREQGMITPEEEERAAESEVRLARSSVERSEDRAAYFVETVRQILEARLGTALYTQGYRIHTTLDRAGQQVLEEEVARQLDAIESGRYGAYRHGRYADRADSPGGARTPYVQGAGVIMDATTGDVLALVGGRDFADSEYNRATQARRQPGSAFKPFVYTAALARGYPLNHPLEDTPLRIVLDNGRVWEPRNYGGSYAGRVTLREALVHSRNVATVRLAEQIGLSQVIGTARMAGLSGDIPPYPAVVLGSAEVTLLDLTSAYTPFATLGRRSEPRFVVRVEDRAGRTVYATSPEGRRVLDPAVAFLTTSVLQDVVSRGTATAVRAAGFRGPVAGKTGTTNEGTDTWFIGYTPERVAGIWIGLDDPQQIVPGATGGSLAAPAWGRAMRRLGHQGGGWSPPPGVETRTVDEVGNMVGAGCPVYGDTRQEFFLAGTAPASDCLDWDHYAWDDSLAPPYDTLGLHPDSGRDGWWDRLRERVLGDQDSSQLARERRLREREEMLGARTDTLRRIHVDSLGQVRVEDEEEGDTIRRRRVSGDREPNLLGRPVRTDADTLRPGSRRPPPDTGRSNQGSRPPG